MYDYLIVGAGLFGAVFAHEAKEHGKSCLVIDKRNHIAGNIYTEVIEGIDVHKYGAHIFHTSNKQIWDYVCRFCEMNNFVNSPIANFKGEIYNLPFNMNTFAKIFNISTPQQAKAAIESEKKEIVGTPNNLEQQAISLVGRTIYTKLIKGYTEKQWGRDCTTLPPFIIKRLPVRFTYNNNYFNDRYQGIPVEGYTSMVEKMLEGVEVWLNTPYESSLKKLAKKTIYTGAIDEYYDYKFGRLEYRTVSFQNELLDTDNYQGVAVVNYTDRETPYTRIIEHKHFNFGEQPKTYISKEYPTEWKEGLEPYYPVNDEVNNNLYTKYFDYSKNDIDVIFGGRLGMYKYYDMDKVIESALECAKREFGV